MALRGRLRRLQCHVPLCARGPRGLRRQGGSRAAAARSVPPRIRGQDAAGESRIAATGESVLQIAERPFKRTGRSRACASTFRERLTPHDSPRAWIFLQPVEDEGARALEGSYRPRLRADQNHIVSRVLQWLKCSFAQLSWA